MPRGFDHHDAEQRKKYFSELYGMRWQDEVCLMPPRHQGRIHELLKQAFYAGSNYQRKLEEPVQVGGVD